MITLAAATIPRDIAAQLAALLDDPARRERQSRAGLDFVRDRTWEGAADPIEQALRSTLAARLSPQTRSGAQLPRPLAG